MQIDVDTSILIPRIPVQFLAPQATNGLDLYKSMVITVSTNMMPCQQNGLVSHPWLKLDNVLFNFHFLSHQVAKNHNKLSFTYNFLHLSMHQGWLDIYILVSFHLRKSLIALEEHTLTIFYQFVGHCEKPKGYCPWLYNVELCQEQ